jgi:AcrR family transcriptional regulator
MPERRWGGTTLEDRREERRERLLEVGYALMGDGGVAAVTVRGACREAKLSERYFYESFDDREALVWAVYDRTVSEARDEIVRAAAAVDDPPAAAGATMDAYMRYLEADPRRVRILLKEPVVNAELGEHRFQLLPMFTTALQARFAELPDGPDATDAALTSTAVVGAILSLYLNYFDGSLVVSRERLIDHAAQVLARTWSIRSGS